MMHMRGTPQTMQSMTHMMICQRNVILFSEKIKARSLGINDLIVILFWLPKQWTRTMR
jgi:dihydropteroate synthase